jgi:hypothetical protein
VKSIKALEAIAPAWRALDEQTFPTCNSLDRDGTYSGGAESRHMVAASRIRAADGREALDRIHRERSADHGELFCDHRALRWF